MPIYLLLRLVPKIEWIILFLSYFSEKIMSWQILIIQKNSLKCQPSGFTVCQVVRPETFDYKQECPVARHILNEQEEGEPLFQTNQKMTFD